MEILQGGQEEQEDQRSVGKNQAIGEPQRRRLPHYAGLGETGGQLACSLDPGQNLLAAQGAIEQQQVSAKTPPHLFWKIINID